MKRKLKILGLALVVLFVLSAVAAAAAWSAPKWTPVPEEYPVTLKGSQTVALVLEMEGTRPIVCKTATFEGTIASKAEAEESKLRLSPAYSGCTATILGNPDPVTMTMNGCEFVVTTSEAATGTVANEGWEYTGTQAHIACPTGKTLEIHVYTSATNDLFNTTLCTYHVAPQTPLGDLDFKLTEKESLNAGTSSDLKPTLTGLTYHKTSGSWVNCGPEDQTGSMAGEIRFEAFNSKGEMLRGKYDPS